MHDVAVLVLRYHAWGEYGEKRGDVAHRRKLGELLGGDDGAGRCGSCVDQRRCGRDHNGFRLGADFERDINLFVVRRPQGDSAVICGLESGRSHGELIRAGQQELDNPVPLSVGLGLPCDAGII